MKVLCDRFCSGWHSVHHGFRVSNAVARVQDDPCSTQRDVNPCRLHCTCAASLFSSLDVQAGLGEGFWFWPFELYDAPELRARFVAVSSSCSAVVSCQRLLGIAFEEEA